MNRPIVPMRRLDARECSEPNQDMRFDVPTIGPQTIAKVHAAGGTAIVIEADMRSWSNVKKPSPTQKPPGLRLSPSTPMR